MINYLEINNIFFSYGKIIIYWYGVIYLISYFVFFIINKKYNFIKNRKTNKNNIIKTTSYCIMGTIIGSRLGYTIFYDYYNILANPFKIFHIWKGGMSLHGGLMGAIITMIFLCIKKKILYIYIMDIISLIIPISITIGRIGNLINGELWGKINTSKTNMIFYKGGCISRCPTQIIEIISEGLFLFLILKKKSEKDNKIAKLSGNFLIYYGIFRFSSEIFREPNYQVGYLIYKNFTIGQILSLLMYIVGLKII